MTKTASSKTNGHTIADLKEAAPAPRAARAAAKPAAKAPVKASAKAPVKAAVKTPAKAAAKPAAAKPAAAKPAAAKPAAAKPAAAKPAAAKPAAVKPAAVKPAAAKPAPKRAAPAPAAEVEAGSRDKARKAKLVRDSFTMPEQEYAVLGQVKKACLKAGFEIKKSELLRIGVALISDCDIATLQKVLSSLPQLKTGRPKSE
ncbi:hypothetical protein [Massilia atriviolacea]|uniref:hypothetical protein n=1 Tax=Massilia atriviolacea TaxID=2495579 RepID=UPI001E5AC9CA|nr:hypothetical protein [Massilia atriviolacea]